MKSVRYPLLAGLALVTLTLACSCKKSRDPGDAIELPELKLKKGQTVRAIMETVTENGTIKIVGGKENGSGTMFVQRVRVFEKTRTRDGFRYNIQKNDSNASFEWKGQETPSETHTTLTGRPVLATRGDDGWKMTLAEGHASPAQIAEIKAFEAYANRQWLPGHPVKIGDSWPCQPGFIKHFIQSDLIKTSTGGTLTLLSIEGDNAIVSVNIHGSGEHNDQKTLSKASINLTGTAVFSIQTGLDLGLDLKGSVTSGVQHANGEIKAVLLPVTLKVRKKILE
ncbi:MAG: hypothetical protein QM496_18655 [Verrucomicrobiota bacterium]